MLQRRVHGSRRRGRTGRHRAPEQCAPRELALAEEVEEHEEDEKAAEDERQIRDCLGLIGDNILRELSVRSETNSAEHKQLSAAQATLLMSKWKLSSRTCAASFNLPVISNKQDRPFGSSKGTEQ